MNLDAAQKQKVAGWIDEGLKLSDIQNRLSSEFGVHVTYMEVRLLMDDLKLRPKENEAPTAAAELAKSGVLGQAAPASGNSPGPSESIEEEEAAPGSGISVTVDQVTRPGALVSGRVNFSDGNSAEWHLDQFGRLGLVPKQPGY